MPMALMGQGTSSLVAAWLVQATLSLVASYALKPHPIKPLFWYPGAGLAVNTGRAVFLTNTVNWMLNNLDRILIGRILNTHALGLYNVAYNLATTPNALLLGAVQPAFLAAGARLQNNPQRLGRAYVQMIATVLVLCVPAFVLLLYGPRWRDAGWVLGILFLGIPAYVVWGLSTPILWNTQRKHYEFALQLPLVFLGALAYYQFAEHGIRIAAVIASLLLLARALVIGAAAFRAVDMKVSGLLPHAWRGLLLSVVCAFGVLAGQQITASLQSPILSLMASGLLALAMTGGLVVMRTQVLGDQTADMLVRFIPALAGVLKKAQRQAAQDTLGEQHV